MVPPGSEPAAVLLVGLEHTCWPIDGTWVLTGAAGRARAGGLLWVCGIGRALCTGLGLGSPDFIFAPTRRAGILFWGRLVTARSPPSPGRDGNPAAHMRRSTTTVCESHSRCTTGTRWAIGPLILLDISEGTKLPRRQTRGLKSHNCHLFLTTLNHIEDKCLRDSQWRGGRSGNSPQVQKKKIYQNSLFALRGVPIGLAAGFLSIYLQH